VPAISVGSVEVDVVPNAQGIDARLRAALVPPASRIGDEVGRIIGRQIATQMAPAIRDGINNGARAARPAATRQGDETGGAFSRSLKARLEAAFRSLPRADVRLGDTGFDADMARLRARLETLSGKRIGIDVDAGLALTEIADIEERLKRLGAEHPNVQVRADTAAALAQLAALRAEVDAVDGKNVDIDASPATASFNGLVFAAIALGPAILPVLPVIAAGLGAIAAAGTAAAAGVGSIALVAAPAFKQIAGVLQAQKAAQDAATTSTLRGAQANSSGASKALQMAGAQQSLATARRNAAREIADAERGVSDAVRQAAQANAQAAAQVKQDRQGLADAYTQASERMQQANQQVASAERDLEQAQKSERQAQLDLTAARKEASRQLEDMNNQLADAQLSLRDAQIQVVEAKQNLDATLANPRASVLQRQQAQLTYDQAVQHLKEQQLETKRLQSDTTAANKAGVDGSKTVQDAQDRLAQAQQNVTDKTAALKTAQQNVAKTQIQNTRAIADAQEKLSVAQKNVAETQRQGAESIARAQERVVQAQQSGANSIASAQRQIASASLSAAGGVDQAAIAQSKYQAALAKLTPSARATLNAFVGLRTAFGAWSKALQPAVMPIFTKALVSMRNTLPTLTPFVLGAASAIKTLQDRASTSVKSPFWQGFKKDLQTNVKPAIVSLGVAFGNVLKGMAGIIDAFLPHMDGISSRLQRITGRFANWGANLKGSPEFEQFLSFVSTHGPILAKALGDIFGAFLKIGEALSPLSGPFLQFLGGMANAIGIIAEHAPWFIQLIYGIILATKLWTLAQIAFNFVMSANPLVLIGLAILALVGLVIYAYNRFGWFRKGVQAVWDWLKTATLWLWNSVLKPTFTFIGDIVVWLWKHAIKPYIGLVVFELQVFGAVAMWLWNDAVKPAFHFIAEIVAWLWKNVIKPNFAFIRAAVGAIGDVFRWLYEKVIKPVWEKGIAPVISGTWKYGIKPVFDTLKSVVGHIGDAFRDAATAIAKNWSKIKDAAKAPVNFVIRAVWNDGIVSVWKKIGGWIPGLPKLGKLPLLAQGGTVPAAPGVFSRPTAIVGEGRSQHPEYVIPTDPRYRGRALALWQQAGGQLMASGGILGGIFGGIGGKIGSWFSSAKNFLTNPGKALDGLFGKLLTPLDAIKSSAWGKLAIGLPKAIFKGLKDLVSGGGGSGGPIGGTIPKGSRLAVINQALAAAGVPPPGLLAQWQAGLNTLVTRESGWNPRAINRWDSNAKAGHPSQGLAQTIPSTFAAYVPAALRGRGILDPVANVAAAVRYIVSRYGNITRVQQANANMPPAGYDSGGWMPPGMNLMYNGLGRPEAVLTPSQWSAIHGAAVRGSDGAQAPVVIEVHGKEGALGDFIDVRVQEHDQRLIQVINAS